MLWGRIRTSIAATPFLWYYRLSRRVVVSLAVLLSLFGGGVATVFAAADSVPGDTLFPIYLAIEEARIAIAPTEELREQLQVRFAQKRLEKVRIAETERAKRNSGSDDNASKSDFAATSSAHGSNSDDHRASDGRGGTLRSTTSVVATPNDRPTMSERAVKEYARANFDEKAKRDSRGERRERDIDMVVEGLRRSRELLRDMKRKQEIEEVVKEIEHIRGRHGDELRSREMPNSTESTPNESAHEDTNKSKTDQHNTKEHRGNVTTSVRVVPRESDRVGSSQMPIFSATTSAESAENNLRLEDDQRRGTKGKERGNDRER